MINNIEETIISSISTLLKVPISRKSNRKALAEWDSLKHIQIVFLLEDTFEIRIDEAHVAKMQSVQDIVTVVKECLGTQNHN